MKSSNFFISMEVTTEPSPTVESLQDRPFWGPVWTCSQRNGHLISRILLNVVFFRTDFLFARAMGYSGGQQADDAGEVVGELQANQEQQHLDSLRLLQAVDGIRRSQDEDKVAQKGTLGAIGRPEELDVYLARGCDTLEVEVCGTLVGRELFHGLKRACEHAKHVMQAVQWPTVVTNRLAYGIAAFTWGGRDHGSLPDWAVSVADFPHCKAEEFDAYTMPPGTKLEPRPRHPVVFSQWVRQAENELTSF